MTKHHAGSDMNLCGAFLNISGIFNQILNKVILATG